MIAKVGEDIYKVTFAHIQPKTKRRKMATLCNVWKYNENYLALGENRWTNLNYGIAKCGVDDNFCKETGRKIALTRALRYFEDKEIRTAIWDAYFHRDNIGNTKEIRDMASNAGYDLDC